MQDVEFTNGLLTFIENSPTPVSCGRKHGEYST